MLALFHSLCKLGILDQLHDVLVVIQLQLGKAGDGIGQDQAGHGVIPRREPKGFVRVLGKIAELKDSGIDIYFFMGNHDLWMKDYLQKELGIPVFFEKQYFEINGKNFLLAHGENRLHLH